MCTMKDLLIASNSQCLMNLDLNNTICFHFLNRNDIVVTFYSRAIITEVLGELQFNFYHRWFDVMFLVAAVCTIAIIVVVHKRDFEPAENTKQKF